MTRPPGGPHGPSTGLQATTKLDVVLPATLSDLVEQTNENQALTTALGFLQQKVPALANSVQVEYRGPGGMVVIAGGPLPTNLRFTDNAEQVSLLQEIGQQISGLPHSTAKGWSSVSTGTLGGQMWCGQPQIPGASGSPAPAGLCYVVDSQNVLIISTIGATDPAAPDMRALVEVPAVPSATS